MLFFIADPSPATPPTAHYSWATGRSQIGVVDGSPDAGDLMILLTDTGPQATNAVQATNADRPVWRPADFPGRGGCEVVGGDHFDAPIGAVTVRNLLVIWDGTVRGVIARDTGATTNFPAFTLSVTEDFG